MTSQTTGRDDLIALERKFWNGDAAFYRQNLDDTCLIAFTQMSGAFGKATLPTPSRMARAGTISTSHSKASSNPRPASRF
ncbi:MAG TPA: hypothetical protein VFC54_10950 [Pseudolabrys sp.]|nr:hypothetical protein [Pseudolabrys sp.]